MRPENTAFGMITSACLNSYIKQDDLLSLEVFSPLKAIVDRCNPQAAPFLNAPNIFFLNSSAFSPILFPYTKR